jgi:hypothetical protein
MGVRQNRGPQFDHCSILKRDTLGKLVIEVNIISNPDVLANFYPPDAMEERPHGLPSRTEAAEKMQKSVESLSDQRPAIASCLNSRLWLRPLVC